MLKLSDLKRPIPNPDGTMSNLTIIQDINERRLGVKSADTR